jgi:DNA polymerase-3 subunit delta
MHFIVYGADTYRSQKKLASLRAKFKADRDPTGLNERLLRAGEHGVEAVAEALCSSPFMAERKLVVLEGFCGANKDVQTKLVELLSTKPDSTVAIFYEAESRKDLKTSPLLAALADCQFSEEFTELSAEQMVGMVAAECAELGLQIDRRAGQQLVQAVGADSWALHHEVSKLSAYAQSKGQEMITMEMVNELTTAAVEDSVFEFLDSCTQGQPRRAIALLESMVASGTNELQLLAMLQRQVRTLIGARDLLDRGVTDRAVVAKQLGIHPYPAGKAVTAVRRLSADKLKDGLGELLAIEHRFKTGQGKIKAEIGMFAVKMS